MSSEDFATTANWFVDVNEMYIDSHQPDSIHKSIRRNSTLDFSASTRQAEDEPIEFMWLLDGEEISDEDNVSIRFEQSRDYNIIVIANQADISDSITWQMNVNDLIVNNWPEELELAVSIYNPFEFEVFPFNPLDGSLNYLWTLDGDSIGDSSIVSIDFNSERLYSLTAYVTDTTETDSVTWEVTPTGIDSDDKNLIPETLTLNPPHPNPFNSTTNITYHLPTESLLNLSLYDISGRQVMTLFSGVRQAGKWSTTLNGSELSSGIYFVRMNAGSDSRMQKVVLIK